MYLPEQVVALHKDINSVTESGAVSIICMPQWGLLKQAAPLCIFTYPLVLQPVNHKRYWAKQDSLIMPQNCNDRRAVADVPRREPYRRAWVPRRSCEACLSCAE